MKKLRASEQLEKLLKLLVQALEENEQSKVDNEKKYAKLVKVATSEPIKNPNQKYGSYL
jgi:hypothetical protein